MAAGALILRVRVPGTTALVVVAGGARGGRAFVVSLKAWKHAALSAGDGASPEKQRWRTLVEGSRLVGVTRTRVDLARDEDKRVTLSGSTAGVAIAPTTSGDRASPCTESYFKASERDACFAEGDAQLASLADASFAARALQVRRSLDKALAKLGRRAEAIRGDRARVAEAGAMAAQATAFVAAASQAPRGARSLTVTDWGTGESEPREITLPLDPARPARAQIDAMFKRARRLKLGAAIVEKRLAEAEATLAALEVLRPRALAATSLEELEAVARDAFAAAPRDFSRARAAPAAGGRARARDEARTPYRAFVGPSGARILVGKGAAQNDTLTLHVARPHDLWLHAKGRTGAHVIVPLEKKQTCPGDTLVEAALLAAHFSDARDDARVDVQYTPRRFLRKPRGSGPGFVIVDREKVLALRRDAGLLAMLLAREEPAR